VRKVYSPPVTRTGWSLTTLGALAITLSVFLVLPLTQMISSYAKRELLITRVDATSLQAPTDLESPPPPPPEEKPPEEPPPQLSDAEQPLNLSVDLDMAVGTGGAMAMGSLAGLGSNLTQELAQALDVSELDRPPSLVASVPPAYPAELRRARIEGTVVLIFVLNESGRVEDPRVETSSRPEFEPPALEAIRRWRFKPGEKNGEPVRTYMRLPIRFRATG
jgi:periplasmic protein TonB